MKYAKILNTFFGKLGQLKACGCQLMLHKPWAVEHIITRSVLMYCSAAYVILENQLTLTRLVLAKQDLKIYLASLIPPSPFYK